MERGYRAEAAAKGGGQLARPVAMIKRELDAFTVEPGMLFVIQPHVVDAQGRRGVQLGNLVVCEQGGARSLQQAAMRFFQAEAQ